jgi:cell division protein FtsI/penicillin-binding protein 2
MRPHRRFWAVLSVAAVMAAGLAGCTSEEDRAREALAGFLDGWRAGGLDEVRFVSPTGAPVPPAEVAAAIGELSGGLAQTPPALAAGEVTVAGDLATGEVSVDWPLPGGGTWTYRNLVRLADSDGGWRVIWEPAVVHPELLDGDRLAVRRLPATRGEILDGDGEPVVTSREVVEVGIEPRRVTDLDALVAELDDAFRSIDVDLDLSDLPDRVDAAEEDQFVDVVTLRRDDYDRIRDRIQPLPGTVFEQAERHLAPSRTFARALLGVVRPAFAEDVENNPGVIEAGDQVGAGGLSGQYDSALRGVVGHSVLIARTAPDGAVNETELDRIEPVPGADLATTLDVDVQSTAEQALSAESKPSALVAIGISDGAVLAVANTEGDRALDTDIALTGAVPPGSTFKLVSAYALLGAGEVTLDTPVDCPDELAVGGFRIRNAFTGDRGEIPFREAVAISCNTAFAGLAPRLGEGGLAAAGTDLGLGGDWNLGLDTFTGAVPTGGSELDRAVAAFGQGETQVSPAAMAAATAAVARGAWLPPRLVVDPAAPAAAPVPLDQATVADLHTALREVVTSGTARELAGVPGGDVHGKTGTAEAGPDVTHGWFVGWQGDVAFAVFVEDGRSGSGAAVPLAERFLRALAG